MRYIPLAFFSSQAPGPVSPEFCYCDTASFTLTPTSPFTGVSRLVTYTECTDGVSNTVCYGRGGTTPITRTIIIKKGTTISYSNSGGCPAGNGTISSPTYNRNYCPQQYTDYSLYLDIQNCLTNTVYTVRFYNSDSNTIQPGTILNLTNVSSITGGLVPNGCYTILGTISSTPVSVNFIVGQNYTQYSSCNECVSSL